MRLQTTRLTIRVVDAVSAEPLPTGERLVWDADVRGLGLRLRASGGDVSRRWIFRYTFRGRRRFISIGEYGQPWTIETARDEARRLQGQVASKLDPAAQREAARTEPTLELAATQWIRQHAEHHQAPDSVAGNKGLLARLGIAFVDVEQNGRSSSELAKARVDALSQRDMRALHASMHKTPTQANRTMSLLSAIFTWSGRVGAENPCRGVKRYRERKVERILSPEELVRLIQILMEAKEEESPGPIIVGAIMLLLLTGARPKELLTARREWFDAEAGTLKDSGPEGEEREGDHPGSVCPRRDA